jgi:MFS family permease
LLFVIGLFSGTGMALGMPARTPLMAEVVGHEQVMSAIAMSNAAMNGTRLIGPALAGAIVGVWGLDIVYFSQAGLNVISMAILLAVPTGLGAGGSRAAKGSMFAEIGAGLKYTATDPRLRLLILMMFGITFLAMPYTMLLPGFVQEDLGRGPGAYGILQSVSGVGALVGSLVIASMTEFERKPLVQWIAGVLGGAGLIVLAVTTAMFGYAGAIGTIIFLGLTLTAYQTLNSTMLMDEARPEFYGRVMSISMMTFSAMPLMAYPLGAIADAVGAKQTFVAEGGWCWD